EMSDGTPVSPELDARMLADLREWRRRYPIASMHGITGDEVDMLLRVAAERDALRRELVDMPDDHLAPVPVRSVPFTAEIPDEVRERAGEPATDERPRCDVCSSVIVPDRFSTGGWRHEIRPMRLHVAKPIS
ncbi:hypothetical protein, partial [Parasutterella excrementihominis]